MAKRAAAVDASRIWRDAIRREEEGDDVGRAPWRNRKDCACLLVYLKILFRIDVRLLIVAGGISHCPGVCPLRSVSVYVKQAEVIRLQKSYRLDRILRIGVVPYILRQHFFRGAKKPSR